MEPSQESGTCVGQEDPKGVSAVGGHPTVRSGGDSRSQEGNECRGISVSGGLAHACFPARVLVTAVLSAPGGLIGIDAIIQLVHLWLPLGFDQWGAPAAWGVTEKRNVSLPCPLVDFLPGISCRWSSP